ncbi:putative amidase [Nemania sp. FL0031]|nr:putative amidase [Nemania sp. FL0031]
MATVYPAVQTIAGTQYLVHPQVVGLLDEKVTSSDITPILVLRDSTLRGSADELTDLLKDFGSVDDVYKEEFSHTLVVHHSDIHADTRTSVNLKRPPGCSTIYNTRIPSDETRLPPGPYFLHGSSIHQAWRLYADELDAFIFGAIPDDVFEPKRFQPLATISSNGLERMIAVPSRLYHTVTREKPFAGSRTALKDIFSLEGVKTTMMSRSYVEVADPDTRNADYVKKLLKLGAVIVGKTKMTQFASSDEPTDQWIDFHCPINPRGDQYQSPSGSSSGAAAALAGYDWLDQSIGGDSAGSIRAPATCNGLFSLRPSFGSTSMEGIIINSKLFDVVGLFSRTLDNLYAVASKTMNLQEAPISFPTRILYPLDFFPHSNKKHQEMVDEFIGVLEEFLGTKRVEFSIAERWSQCPPEAAQGKPLKDYLPKSAFWPMCRDYYQGFGEFRSKYKSKYEKDPYVGPVVRYRWGIGESVTEQDYQTYTNELEVFRKWFNENVISANSETLSDAIMIMPYGSANPKYRDAPNEDPSSAHTIGEKFISPVLQMPQLVLPFAQMPYDSRVSGNREHRPIASTLVGAKDKIRSDLMLISLARAAFKAKSWPTSISTGRYMFPLAENVRNVRNIASL